MQLSSVQSSLIWLLLTALAIAATPPVTGVTSIGTGPLSLINTVNLKANSIAHCRHDDDPGHYTSSLNYTFPDTPPLPQSFLESVGFNESEGSYPFDCFFDISVVVVEIKGEIDSNLRLAFEVWLSVLVFNYEIGVYSCDLLDLEKDPCAFNIDKKYFHGQGGIYPKQDPDPDYVDLCLELHGVVKIPYTRVSKKIDLEKCFYRFPHGEGPEKASLGGTTR